MSPLSASLLALVPAAGIGARAQRPGAAPARAGRAPGAESEFVPEPGTMPGAESSGPLPKQYRLLRGQPMLRHAVAALLADPRIREVRVAVAPDDPWAARALAGLPRTVVRYCGGDTRAATVANALADSGAAADDWVLVHDAARPGLPADALGRLIDACLGDAVGGLLALPVADTVKGGLPVAPEAAAAPADVPAIHAPTSAPVQAATSANAVNAVKPVNAVNAAEAAPRGAAGAGAQVRVARTVDRDGLWLAQTPQMFRAGMLADALRAAARDGTPVTDEASALEAAGHAPLLVPGALRNFKVTWPDDFDLMEKWL